MNQADRIRQIAFEAFILPARAAGRDDVIIRAGDLHALMKLDNAMPAVCSALGGGKFEQLAGVKRLDVTGPANGANVYFRFDVTARRSEPAPSPSDRRIQPHTRPVEGSRATQDNLDLSDAVVLVSCVKSKLSQPAPARMLYCSDWFTKVRHLIEAQGACWFVLSAQHGLVPADKEVAPYELTLNTMGTEARRAWAEVVYRSLVSEIVGYKRVVFFAGLRYREFLVEPLARGGWTIEVPMDGLPIGKQLAWLAARQ